MNPMIAYSWLFYFSKGSTSLLGAYYQKEYIVVYCVTPMIAAGFAALLVSILPDNSKVVTSGTKQAPKQKEEPVRAKALASNKRTSSRGRGGTVQEEEPREEVMAVEGSGEVPDPEPDPVAHKKPAPQARRRTASR